jgi:hypothetical protein
VFFGVGKNTSYVVVVYFAKTQKSLQVCPNKVKYKYFLVLLGAVCLFFFLGFGVGGLKRGEGWGRVSSLLLFFFPFVLILLFVCFFLKFKYLTQVLNFFIAY